jgi:hypothetical protein
LLLWASFPLERLVPSFRMITGICWDVPESLEKTVVRWLEINIAAYPGENSSGPRTLGEKRIQCAIQGDLGLAVAVVSIVKLARVEPLIVSQEDMDRLYFDHRPVRHYCLQCRGPKYMAPSEKNRLHDAELAATKAPAKYAVVCKSCRTKYTVKVGLE